MKAQELLFTGLLFTLMVLPSCKNGNKQNADTGKDSSDSVQIAKSQDETPPAKTGNFNINDIPVSNAVLGEFPYFSLPQGLEVQNKPIFKSYDELFFPIDGIMTPIEGKVWKGSIVMAGDSKETWSLPYYLKSYDDAITNAGGVKIFDDKVTQKELDRIDGKATYFGEGGSLDYWNDPAKVYLIRRENKDDIYIQLSGNTASGALQILQKKPFKQTITLLQSAEIKKELDEKGKAVLHINFDTDKATLKPDGRDAIGEILKVLQGDNNLRLAINGYTDNTGSDDKNLQLSTLRAETVKKELIGAGIDKQRLSSAGFGTKNPVADNSTEDGKAQNRRVELVKI